MRVSNSITKYPLHIHIDHAVLPHVYATLLSKSALLSHLSKFVRELALFYLCYIYVTFQHIQSYSYRR